MDNTILNKLLRSYVADPNNFETNFSLALHYDSIHQTASALSFYLRAAERTSKKDLMYECLVRAAYCFIQQGSRNFTVKGILQRAIIIRPKRPEAYFLLSTLLEKEKYDGHWNDCYLIASLGEANSEDCLPLKNIGYPGKYALPFEKAVSGWWCGLCDESRDILKELLLKESLDSTYHRAVFDNLKRIYSPMSQYLYFPIYTKNDWKKLKEVAYFPGAAGLARNYSEAFQDLFVLTMLKGKVMGTYLEIGAGHPLYGNNTYLFEQWPYHWEGLAIDNDPLMVSRYNEARPNPKNRCIEADALTIDWKPILDQKFYNTDEIDYLQIDCDPAENSYKALQNIPFAHYKFAVITFEHDLYWNPENVVYQQRSADLLHSQGYVRVIKNVSPDENRPYEDWWVHPDLVDLDLVLRFSNTDDTTKKASTLFLN